MGDAAEVIARARQSVSYFLDDLVSRDLFDELGPAATDLYKQQYTKKQNPYGEAWEPRPGDERRTQSTYKFGKVAEVERDGFSLIVARANAKRSCVPFEPRGLGAWRPNFEEIVLNRARLLFRNVRP